MQAKMKRTNWRYDFRSHLRTKCLVIGYWHLIASLVSISCHVSVVYFLTNGFNCEITKETLRSVQWDWLDPVLLIVNFGVHGLYAFPLILNYHQTQSIKYLAIPENNPACSTMWTQLENRDVTYFVISMIWLVFVVSFIIGIHKKYMTPVIAFAAITIFKLVIQIPSFASQSSYNNGLLDLVYKIVDVCLIFVFLKTLKCYIKKLWMDRSREKSLVENVFNELEAKANDKKLFVYVIQDEKKCKDEMKKSLIDVEYTA